MNLWFVCTGNTCRSPMAQAIAEKILREKGLEVKADSAGIYAIDGQSISENSALALAEKGLFLRGGFHCAPLAHRYLGTEESGALRLSPGLFNTPAEIERALNILESV